jgi:hypothetical protein
MIRNACNLIYKDAYTSIYKMQCKCKLAHKESYTYATKELPHTKLTKDWLLEGRQKGSTPPAKEQRGAKLTSSP